MAFPIDENRLDEFFWTARERYNILLKRRAGVPREDWTDVQVFKKWRFCNVFREDDRTTIWFRENLRDKYRDRPAVVVPLVFLARLVNHDGNLAKLLDAGLLGPGLDYAAIYDVLKECTPVTGGGYMVNTPAGMDKAAGVVDVASRCAVSFPYDNPPTTLRDTWATLTPIRNIASFTAYEFVTDLRHTCLLENAPDINTWAPVGPGSKLGLSWLATGGFDFVTGFSKSKEAHIVETMQKLLTYSRVPDLWPEEFPRWEMREVEHWLCEYAKFVKGHHIGVRLKRKFQ